MYTNAVLSAVKSTQKSHLSKSKVVLKYHFGKSESQPSE